MSSSALRAATTASLRLAPLAVALAALHGCSSGTGGSDVGADTRVAPTARAQVLNGGTTNTFREGAEVLLTGKASEDRGGPLIHWSWSQTAGPAVELIEANSTTVGFTAPDVDAPATLTFRLEVEDATGDTGTATVDVGVVPAGDADKFLSLDVRTGGAFDSFKVVAALAGGASTGASPKPFTLSARAYVAYPPRTAPDADCTFEPSDFAGGVPAAMSGGCRVELLADLTPDALAGGGTGIESEWPAGVTAPDESDEARISRWWNPRFTLPIPRLDARELNQRFVDRGERDRLLDGFAAHRARIVLDVALTAPENQGDAALIVTDLTDAPVRFEHAAATGTSATIANAGNGLPTAAALPVETLLAGIAGREAALTAEVYYRTVDPMGTRTTLNDWLEQAGFASDAAGTLVPEATAGTGEFAHAIYLNNYDLGFGRRMHSRVDELGNVFSFVRNYATLESAIRGLDSFVTVVMEYSPLLGHADAGPKFVKFFTYVDDGSGDERRVASFDFDGRGERYTPGNCTVCHGGARPPGVAELVFDAACGNRGDAQCYAWPAFNRDGEPVAGGNLQALFLPWDVDSLLFADTDPAITGAPVPFDGVTLAAELARDYGDYSRAAQLDRLRKLNQSAYATYADADRAGAVRRLVEHWYGVDASGALLGPFDGSTAIAGWRGGELVPDPADAAAPMIANPDDADRIYTDVYAAHCRMCHANMLDATLRFETYRELAVLEDAIERLVYARGIMPAARLTMDRFWSPFAGGTPPGDVLAAHFAAATGDPPAAAPGGGAAVIVGLDPPSNRGDTVYLDGSTSAFADSYAWTLAPPAGSAARLVGAAGPNPTFAADVPGTYAVTLTINAGAPGEDTVTASQVIANRAPRAANDLFDLDLSAGTALAGSVVAGVHQDADPDGDALTATLAGAPPAAGSVALDPDGTFVYTYTGSVAAAPASDSFGYRIADGHGGDAEATVTVLLNTAPAGARPTAPVLVGAADASTAAQAASVFAANLAWEAASDDVGVTGYNVYRDGALLDFVASAAPPGTPVAYTDATALPDATHTYRVTALDGANESALSAAVGVEIVTSLRRNIQTGWGAGSETLWAVSNCVGCHRGQPGGLRLFGNADQVYAELTEDAGGPAPLRVDPADPLESLMLCKPLQAADPNDCAHGGGDFLVISDPAYQTLKRWIEDGAPDN